MAAANAIATMNTNVAARLSNRTGDAPRFRRAVMSRKRLCSRADNLCLGEHRPNIGFEPRHQRRVLIESTGARDTTLGMRLQDRHLVRRRLVVDMGGSNARLVVRNP
jgi:hypothetical protein